MNACCNMRKRFNTEIIFDPITPPNCRKAIPPDRDSGEIPATHHHAAPRRIGAIPRPAVGRSFMGKGVSALRNPATFSSIAEGSGVVGAAIPPWKKRCPVEHRQQGHQSIAATSSAPNPS